jgi:hypothetical protein
MARETQRRPNELTLTRIFNIAKQESATLLDVGVNESQTNNPSRVKSYK